MVVNLLFNLFITFKMRDIGHPFRLKKNNKVNFGLQ